MRGVTAVAVALWLGVLSAGMPAQGDPLAAKQTAVGLERELGRRQNELIEKRGNAERWMDLLIRHQLGLPIDLEKICALGAEERARTREELEQELTQSLDAVARASTELEQKKQGLREQRAAILERPVRDPAGEWGPGIENLQPPVSDRDHRPLTVREEEKPVEAEAADPVPPPPVLIRGAIDPLHRGVAFFMAGQHEKAVESLQKVAAAAKPPPVALFYLARSYEKLGDVARADGLYLQIEAQAGDDAGGAGWTAAARTARQHMNWMREHGQWRLPAFPAEPGK